MNVFQKECHMKKIGVMIIILIILIGGGMFLRQFLDKSLSIGSWVWETNEIEKEEDLFSFFEAEQIDRIYLQIDQSRSYLDYQQFIKEATEKEIEVFALDGGPEWIYTNEAKRFVQWVHSFNEAVEENERFAGIQLDIEPYLLPEWEENREDIIRNFQAIIHGANQEIILIPLELAVPFWFVSLEYHNEFGKGDLAQWVLRKSDQVSVMTYRTELEGENGIFSLFDPFVERAKRENKPIRLAIETMEIDNESISFYFHSKETFQQTLATLLSHYEKDRTVTGIDIHHYKSHKELLVDK